MCIFVLDYLYISVPFIFNSVCSFYASARLRCNWLTNNHYIFCLFGIWLGHSDRVVSMWILMAFRLLLNQWLLQWSRIKQTDPAVSSSGKVTCFTSLVLPLQLKSSSLLRLCSYANSICHRRGYFCVISMSYALRCVKTLTGLRKAKF